MFQSVPCPFQAAVPWRSSGLAPVSSSPHACLCSFPCLKGHFSTCSKPVPCWGPRPYKYKTPPFGVFPCAFPVCPVSSPPSPPQPPEDVVLAAPRCRSQAPGPKECPPSSGQTAGYLPTICAVFSPASRLRGKLFLRAHYEHCLKRYCLWGTLSHQPARREVRMSKACINSRAEIHSCSSNTHSYLIAS